MVYLRDGGDLSMTADPRGTYETAAERNLFILDIGYTYPFLGGGLACTLVRDVTVTSMTVDTDV